MSPGLLPFFRKFTRDESSANDMLQNTFLSIWLDRAKLPDIENLDGFAASRTAPAQDITYQEVLFREAQKLAELLD